MREGGINEILAKLTDIDENDIFYKLLTPANIRKWMFKYLLKNNWPMQNIINHMNITIDNIGNLLQRMKYGNIILRAKLQKKILWINL